MSVTNAISSVIIVGGSSAPLCARVLVNERLLLLDQVSRDGRMQLLFTALKPLYAKDGFNAGGRGGCLFSIEIRRR